jgi:hypothetical protein
VTAWPRVAFGLIVAVNVAAIVAACSARDRTVQPGEGGAAGQGGSAGEAGSADAPALCDDPPEPYVMAECTPSCPAGWHISALSPPVSGCPIAQRACAPNCGTFQQCSLFSPCPDDTTDMGVAKLPECELANYKDAEGNNARVCHVDA